MKRTKTRIEELFIDLEEVRAYRMLQSAVFDFGTGVIENTSGLNEDTHYKIQEQNILNQIRDMALEGITDILKKAEKRNNPHLETPCDYDYTSIKEKPRVQTSYSRKRRDKEELRQMKYVKIDEDMGTWFDKRQYLSKKKKRAKKSANKRLRKYRPYANLRGADYRKVFDYWWEA